MALVHATLPRHPAFWLQRSQPAFEPCRRNFRSAQFGTSENSSVVSLVYRRLGASYRRLRDLAIRPRR